MAIANADGSIILSTKVDTSGVKKATNELRSEAMKLAAQYRKAGMTQSEAQKRAYKELGITTQATEKATKATKKYGEQAQKSGGTAKSAFSSVGGALKKLAVAALAAFSVQKIIQFSTEASNLATTAEASVQRLIDIYGEASKSVGDFIDANAQALGTSKAAAASYASVYGNLFSVWADQATNAELTNAYLNMTAVVASKTGRTVEDVQERIRSGLLGNTEAIEDLGVFVNVKTIEMTDAFQRMANGKSWEQLDAYTQQQIRTFAILEQATQKYGFEVAQTSALTKSQFQAAWQDFQATWGQVVNRVLIPVLDVLTEILITSTAVMQSIFNISSETISQSNAIADATKNQEKLTEEIKKTEKAAKKAFASFDTIQVLSSGDSQEASQTTPIIPEITLPVGDLSGQSSAFLSEIEPIIEKIKGLFEPLSEISFSNLVQSLSSLIDPAKELALVAWDILEDAIEKVIAPLAEFVIEDVLPKFFDTLGTAIDGFRVTLDNVWDILEQFIDEFLTPIWEYAEPKILEVWDDLNAKLKDFVKLVEESEAWEDFQTIMSAIYDVLEPAVKAIIDFVTPIAEFKMSQAFIDLEYTFKNIEDAIGAIADLINGDFDGAWKHLKELFIDNFVDKGKEKFQAFSDVIEGITGFDLSGWVKDAWEAVKQFWNTNIAPIFTAQWWLDLGKTCINGLISGFESGINGIIWAFESMINWIVDGLNSISFDLPDWLGGGTFGINIPRADFGRVSIPRLAQGAVIPPNREFLAVLGDQKQGTNIEAPLQTIVDAFNIALAQNGNAGGNTEVVLEIDGREFGRAVVEQGNRENRRIGTRLVIA